MTSTEEILDMKTVKITGKGQIAIPKDIRKVEGFAEGQKVVIVAFKDHVEIRPLKKMKRISSEDLGWLKISEKSFAKDWLTKEEDEAWKDL